VLLLTPRNGLNITRLGSLNLVGAPSDFCIFAYVIVALSAFPFLSYIIVFLSFPFLDYIIVFLSFPFLGLYPSFPFLIVRKGKEGKMKSLGAAGI
jgi:hypothetical protein